MSLQLAPLPEGFQIDALPHATATVAIQGREVQVCLTCRDRGVDIAWNDRREPCPYFSNEQTWRVQAARRWVETFDWVGEMTDRQTKAAAAGLAVAAHRDS